MASSKSIYEYACACRLQEGYLEGAVCRTVMTAASRQCVEDMRSEGGTTGAPGIMPGPWLCWLK